MIGGTVFKGKMVSKGTGTNANKRARSGKLNKPAGVAVKKHPRTSLGTGTGDFERTQILFDRG